ncbi:hypothetical protein KQY30_24920 [Streptomyces sp. GMY02]|uniref:hypothetical protein n=1 Tax=Streptomyces sp. GMY02 TaxID=1333528 RepID=UPI001C2BB4B1|nr:hypothetical protein [Streptomyces sp. GMY02]QXE36970.1 hypothetical protein KQY30_24920 [Streptomyces sp. GMY02]
MGDVRMRRLRQVTALTWSRLGYAAGCLTSFAGVTVEFGVGWGLMTAGAIAAASFLLLVDVGGEVTRAGGDGR